MTGPGRLVAADPSINSAGVAFFESGVLRAAQRVTSPSGGDIGVRCFTMAARIRQWCRATMPHAPFALVFEWPQIYRNTKSKGDPNDLIGIAGVGSMLAGLYGDSLLELHTPTPAEWIGQCPKVCQRCFGKAKKKCPLCKGSAWLTPRGRRIRTCLTDAEVNRVPDQNDVIDAVGIGLWRLGRLKLVQLFHGAV